MFNVPTEIDIVKYSVPLSIDDIDKGAFFGKRLDTMLPIWLMIYAEMLDWAYNQNPNYKRLQEMGNFAYSLTGKYGQIAQKVIGEGRFINNGNAKPKDSVFPFRLTSVDFKSATECDDARVIGKNIYLEAIENGTAGSLFLFATAGFTYTTTGFKISTGGSATIPDFSSLTTDWIIIVHKLN